MFKKIFRYHFEWIALACGLLLIALMNPYLANGSSLCLFEAVGIQFCPGDGLGHSVAFAFRGDLENAIQAHPLGPVAILVLSGRIVFLWTQAFTSTKTNRKNTDHGKDN